MALGNLISLPGTCDGYEYTMHFVSASYVEFSVRTTILLRHDSFFSVVLNSILVYFICNFLLVEKKLSWKSILELLWGDLS